MRVPLPGATYAFALPSGDWGALYPDHIQTSRGRVELPGEDVLFLVGTLFNGVIYMAGQGHTSGACWLWNGSTWRNLGPTHGVSPATFGNAFLFVAISGTSYLRISLLDGEVTTHEMAIGSQGFRFATGAEPFTGDETYRDGELFEWTEHGSVRVGQGHESGCWINGHLLEPGDCRFIRFDRENDLLAVAIVKLPEQQAVLHWLHVTDIALLPVQAAPPPVHPVPVPVPPQPEPPTMSVPNKSAELAAFHQQWNGGQPITDDAEKHRFTAAFAASLGGRFGRKSRAGNSPLSKDTLGYWLAASVPTVPTDGKLDAVDIINSSGAVGWDTRAEQGDPGYRNIDARWYPVAAVSAPVPQPTPQPAPAPSPDPALLARIRDLEQENAHLEADNAKLLNHPGYDTMMILIAQAEAAFRDAQFGRRKSPMPASIGAHLVYRLMFEGYSLESLVADARERGKL